MGKVEVHTRLLAPGSVDYRKLKYVVIGARYQDAWIFVRHHERITWEMPAGHIEPGESTDRAAERELFEEAGATCPALQPVADYQVTAGETTGYGRLYYAVVHELTRQLEFETDEILLSADLPKSLTYPEVQTLLFRRVMEHERAEKQN